MSLEKIKNRYNPEHDTGPNAPVNWAVMELVDEMERDNKYLIGRIAELEKQVAALVLIAKRDGKL